MNKYLVIIIAHVLFFLSLSCDKKTTEYTLPVKRISKLYADYNVSGSSIKKGMIEEWIWTDEKLLDKIYYYYGESISSTMSYHYNSNNQIVEILYSGDSGRMKDKYIFEYEGNLVKKINVFSHEEFQYYWEFEWDKFKISKLLIYYQSEKSKNTALKRECSKNVLKNFIQKEVIDFIDVTENSPDLSKALILSSTYSFYWDGENISKIEYQHGDYLDTMEMKYDNYMNPYKKSYSEIIIFDSFERLYSTNNVLEKKIITNDQTRFYKYTYEYEEGYPVKVIEDFGNIAPIYIEYVDNFNLK